MLVSRTFPVCLGVLLAALPGRAADPVSFNRDIRPLLADRCFSCHGPDAAHRKADLRLDVAGSTALVPGKPAESELIRRISRKGGAGRMPPPRSGKKLSQAEIALLRRWVELGAPYEKHWSLTPLRRPAVPAVKDGTWPHNSLDRFVLARIEAAHLAPSPDADRVTLLRRLALDLTGLPPAPAEVDDFLGDGRPDAVPRLVERLLASPHAGERLAMYWLDLVRYADTVGYHGDQEHPIGPYRDWVIDALNGNLPFDQFTIEQLAGDLLPEATVDQKIATGYNRLLQTTHEGGAQDGEYRAKYAADRVRNLSVVWLGATMGCAECHDHKFDPYSQRDFYRLAAFFADVEERGAFRGPDRSPTRRPPELLVLSRLDRLDADRLDIALARRKASDDRAELAARRRALEKRRRPTMVTRSVQPRPVRVLKRGDWMDTSGELVGPAVPESLGKLPVLERRPTRLDLARWLVSARQPQTARVFVNRLWYLYLGAGLSRNLEDTGSQGEWPTHPELLDYLAVEFRESGWDVKHVVRLIVTSRTYAQSSRETARLRQVDPDNRLFAHQAAPRLPAEVIRDVALTASGLLVHQVGGPSARPYQPEGYYDLLNFPKRKYRADTGLDQYRRGVYTHWQRQYLQPMLRNFDAPSREECTARRPLSNTPLQALTLLNDPTFVEAARVLAARVLREARDDEERIRRAWRLVLARHPEQREVAALARLLAASRVRYRNDPAAARRFTHVGLAAVVERADVVELAAWTAVGRVLLNLDETITRN